MKTIGYVAKAIGSLAVIMFLYYMTVNGNLNDRYQDASGGKSKYSSALEVGSQKAKGVWAIADQEMQKEGDLWEKFAAARNAFNAADEARKQADQEGDTEAMTKAGAQMVQSALAIRVQIEAYPNWQSATVQRDNMRNMQEVANEIQTALNDWIKYITNYNKYRGNPWVSMFASSDYPREIKYFEGSVTKFDVDSLNPQAPKPQ